MSNLLDEKNIMDFERIKITELKSADYNPRVITKENFEKLKQSLNQFGLVDPIIINLKNDNTIIGGHQRYKVLLQNKELEDLYLLRLGDVGWVFDNIDLKIEDESIEKLMNINLNQTNLMGEWNNVKLESLFTDLELSNIDLDLTGFEEFEIDEISLSNDTTIFNDDLLEEDEDDDYVDVDIIETPSKEEEEKKDIKEHLNAPIHDPTSDDNGLEEFDDVVIDDFEGKHKCPKCGYEWND